MVRKWKLGATGSALLASAFVIVACSSKSDDDENTGGSGGKGASGGTGGTSGKGGSGGAATGGTGGTTGGTGGTTGGTGGTTGGSGGAATGGSGGAAAGAAGAMGFACPMQAATCNLIHTWTFGMNSQWQGTFSYQAAQMLMVDKTTDPTKMHISGMVSDYDGFGVYTGKCSSLTGFTGISFILSGSTSSVDKPNSIKFVVQMNDNEPIDTTNMKGNCVGNPGVECISPNKVIMPSDTAQTIMFSDLAGGKPKAALDVTQVLGLQWQLDPDASKTPYAFDLYLSEVTLIGAGPMGDCSQGSAGSGAGGMSGSGGAATGGMSGATAGGMGGATAGGMGGMGGASGGMGGATTGGMGGASGGMGGKANGGMGGKANGGKAGA